MGEPRGPIWAYAKSLGKALVKIAPEDFRMHWQEGGLQAPFSVSCTIATEQEAEAVCEMIRHMARHLPRHREATREDIYPPEPPVSFHEEMTRFLGPIAASGTPTRRAETGTGSVGEADGGPTRSEAKGDARKGSGCPY